MKIKLVSMAMILALSAGFNANAFNTDDATISIEKKEFKHGHKKNSKHGHKMKSKLRATINEYMLENGDITQGEIDLKKAEIKAAHAELKILKEAGDTEGLAAKKLELSAKRDERKAAMKKYINNNEALKASLEEKKQEIKERRANKREKRKERKAVK